MPKVKRFLLSTILGIYVKGKYQGIYVKRYLRRYLLLGYLPFYYRAMHFSAKRGIAIACRLSVRLSVCL